jgi:indole-3-glycerol phosphate synthase
MSGFLDSMRASSSARVEEARAREPQPALERRALAMPTPPPLRLSPRGFDIIAELKLRSPAYGALGHQSDDWLGRVQAYARGGAAAVSVLTEPSRFDGTLEHLRSAAQALAPLGVPAMRKDFLVDPYQVWEARANGAGGVLVIVRMLQPAQIAQLLDCAAQCGLFVLLEAFDGEDLDLAGELLRTREGIRETVLVGINSRDLQTLQVVADRFDTLAPRLPAGWPGVAESGVNSVQDARHMAQLGFRLALIGSALMTVPEPASLIGGMLAAARTVQP